MSDLSSLPLSPCSGENMLAILTSTAESIASMFTPSFAIDAGLIGDQADPQVLKRREFLGFQHIQPRERRVIRRPQSQG